MAARKKTKLTWIIPLVVFVVFFVVVLVSMLREGAAECRVCVTFKEQRQCATGRAPTEAAAQEEAHRSACSRMTAGVTEAFACPNQPADEVRCSK